LRHVPVDDVSRANSIVANATIVSKARVSNVSTATMCHKSIVVAV
jgi:hypothetical protein